MTVHDTTGYELLSRSELRSDDEVILVVNGTSGTAKASVAGRAAGPFDDGVTIVGVGRIHSQVIGEIWRKPPPCPHDTLRREYDGNRATVYFVCATDSHPECHEHFPVNTSQPV